MKASARESQILDLLQFGLTNKEIGQNLDISPNTVRDRISVMLLRYGLQTRAALAALYTQKSDTRQAITTGERRTSGERRGKAATDPLHL